MRPWYTLSLLVISSKDLLIPRISILVTRRTLTCYCCLSSRYSLHRLNCGVSVVHDVYDSCHMYWTLLSLYKSKYESEIIYTYYLRSSFVFILIKCVFMQVWLDWLQFKSNILLEPICFTVTDGYGGWIFFYALIEWAWCSFISKMVLCSVVNKSMDLAVVTHSY